MSEDSLSWDELADLYDRRTGGTARIKPLEEVYDWAVKQSYIKVNDDTSLSIISKEAI